MVRPAFAQPCATAHQPLHPTASKNEVPAGISIGIQDVGGANSIQRHPGEFKLNVASCFIPVGMQKDENGLLGFHQKASAAGWSLLRQPPKFQSGFEPFFHA
jgi:hypothetical protein